MNDIDKKLLNDLFIEKFKEIKKRKEEKDSHEIIRKLDKIADEIYRNGFKFTQKEVIDLIEEAFTNKRNKT